MKHIKGLVLLLAISYSASAAHIVNSFGLDNPAQTLTFSELTFGSNTVITNQYAAYGVTLSGHHYNSQGNSPFPGITGDYVGVSTTVPFSIFFSTPVDAAAFGYAKNPTTVTIEALLGGVVVDSFSQAVSYNVASTAFLGFSGVTLDEIRVNAGVTEGLIDNIQFGSAAASVPEPSTFGLLAIAAGLLLRARRR